LVIVIAVIAILAAVLIPTFSSIIKKANISADTQLVRNLNTALAEDKAINGEHKTMQSALDAAVEGGYIVARINAKATGNEILWDSVADAFCYLNDGKVEYTPDVTGEKAKDTEQYKLWKIDSVPSKVFSTYLYNIGETTTFNDVKTGIDVGNETVTSITYVGNNGSAQDVVIRTNGGELVVNDTSANSKVFHYGFADLVDVQKIAMASYHENGIVSLIKVKAGHIDLEASADVNGIYIYNNTQYNEDGSINGAKDTSFEEVKITLESGVEQPKLARSAVTVATEGTKVCTIVDNNTGKDYYLFMEGVYEQVKNVDAGKAVTDASAKWVDGSNQGTAAEKTAHQIANEMAPGFTYEVKNAETKVIEVKNSNGQTVESADMEEAISNGKSEQTIAVSSALKGQGTVEDPFQIYDYETMQVLSKIWSSSSNFNYYEVVLEKCERDSNGNPIIDCKNNWISVDMLGEFDGKGVTFINLNKSLFKRVGDIFSIAQANEYKNCVIKNFSVSGNIVSSAAVVSYANGNIKMENIAVHGYAEINNAGNGALFLSFGCIDSKQQKFEFVNCTSDAIFASTDNTAALLLGHPYCATGSTFIAKNCSFTGKVSSLNGKYTDLYRSQSGITTTIVNDITTTNSTQTVEKLVSATGTNPEKYNVFTVDKVAGFGYATAELIVAPDGNGSREYSGGGYTCEFYSESTVDGSMSVNDNKIFTTNIKYYDFICNKNGTPKAYTQSVEISGNQFIITDYRFNSHISNASVVIKQYDSNGNLLHITTFKLAVN